MDKRPKAGYAQIAVLAQLGRAGGLFTYGLPMRLAPMVAPGSLVRVPFSSRQLQGVVCSLEETTDLPRVRDVAELLDPVAVLTPHQLRLARWIADYYAAPLSDVMGAMLPPGLGRKTVYVLEPGAEPNGSRLSDSQRAVLDAVWAAGRIQIEDLQNELPAVDVEKAVSALVRRGLLLRLAELTPPRVSARLVRFLSITSEGRAALDGGASLSRAPKQREALTIVAERGPVAAAEISRLLPNTQAALRALQKKGFVQVEERQSHRSPLFRDGPTSPHSGETTATSPLRLSEAQRQAYTTIARSIRCGTADIYLLHGVTGSGKTEVYLQAVAEAIRGGRQAIVMVPEISLTPQAVERFAGRFPGRVAVLHSKLSAGERVDEWQRIRHGEVDVVVGARSALFAPLPHPGLLVVDEEHDPSYKQDSSPRYNARDAAAVLGRLAGATVVFGSATPDISTYYAARSGRIRLLSLPNRPVWESSDDMGRGTAVRQMPRVEIVDMRQELKSGNRSIFSEPLLAALNGTLEQDQQALLFLNRRGSATMVLCRDCGFVVRCPNCDIPFTYHAAATRLICHRCDKRAVSPQICPTCQSPRIRYLGIGTQRVEEEVTRLFPRARVLRWDRDVTGGKEAHEQILQRFARHEADILVGTQMIAKGLDFPLVTLVGVVSADTGLHMPDFRAPERSFQLLTQVAGRAGRALLPSRVVVQTYTPEHYAVQRARQHDYLGFYSEEMSFRQGAHYPPFARMVRFIYSAENETNCRQSAENLRAILERAVKEQKVVGTELIGPAPCFVAKAKNRYYWQLIARRSVAGTERLATPAPHHRGLTGPNAAETRSHRSGLHALLDYVPAGWAVDVDPVDLL